MAAPNFSGVWRLDAAASTFSGPAPAGLLMKIDHRATGLEQQIVATDAAGAEQRRVFTCRIGEDTISSIGETSLHTRAEWHEEALIIETLMSRQGRTLEFRDHWSLSEDGAILTMAHHDDALAGQTVRLIRDEDSAFPTSP